MKKYLVCVLLLVALAALAACNRGEDGNGDGLGTVGQPFTQADLEVGDRLTLPLTDTTVTFTIWTHTAGMLMGAGLEYIHESYYYQELERRTGINIVTIHPPAGAEQENLNLMIATGDLPDIMEFTQAAMPPGGLSRAIEDGLILDVVGLAERYAPYYWDLIHGNEERRRQAFTDEGLLPGFWEVHVPQPPWFGLTTRQDWLDELGLDTPITFDDWHHALTLFRDEMGARAPMMLPNNGFMVFDVFHAGFNTTPNFYQVNGEVRFGPLGQNFRDYVEMMHQWFSEGLIDQDFAARQMWIGPQDYTTTGLTGLWPDVYVLFPVNALISPDPNYRSVAVPPPVRHAGQTVHLAQKNQPIGTILSITRDASDPVLITRWFNYVYSPPGSTLSNWGIEGQTFVYGPDGFPQFTPLMYDNPDELSLPEAIRVFVRAPGGGFHYDWRRELTPGIHPDVLEALDIWETNVDFAWLMPPITLDADEGSEFAQIMSEINTHRDEMVARFISGAESLDNFDAFINTIMGMGAQRAIEIQQAALDRYNAR